MFCTKNLKVFFFVCVTTANGLRSSTEFILQVYIAYRGNFESRLHCTLAVFCPNVLLIFRVAWVDDFSNVNVQLKKPYIVLFQSFTYYKFLKYWLVNIKNIQGKICICMD